MPPRVETKIVVNINAIVNGLNDIRALGVGVEGVGKFATSSAGGLNRFDSAMSKSQREASKLSAELRELQRELDTLNKKIARDGQFAAPADITRAQALTETIAQRERTLNEQNHLAAVARIKERREAILVSNDADRKDIQKNFDEVAKKQSAADEDFGRRIAQRIEKRRREQAITAAGIEKEAKGISRLGRLADTAIRPLASVGNFVVGIFRQIVQQIEFMVAAFVLLAISAPVLIFSSLVKEGIEFNSVMEQARIGLSALLQSTQLIFGKDQPNKPLEGVAAYTAAAKIAEGVTQRLQIKLIPLRATSEELIPIFNQIITAAAGAGLTIEQTEDTFISLAGAAQILQVPIDRLGTEIRLLLSGTTRETSRLGPALFGSAKAAREFVKEHRAAGDLFPALQQKLSAYNQALIVSTSSYSVLAENAKEVFQRLSALATSTLFDKIKEGLVKITTSFFDLNAGKVKPEFEGLFAFINSELGKVGDFLNQLVDKAIAYLTNIAQYVQQNGRYLADVFSVLVAIGGQLAGILGDLLSVVGQSQQAREKTVSWKTVLELVATVIAAIRDEMKIVIGAFQALAGVIVVAILIPLEAVANVLGIISQRAAEAAVNLHNARVAAQEFAQAGKDRFVEGITFKTTRDQVEAFNAVDREPDTTGAVFRPFVKNRTLAQQQQANKELSDLTFKPNPNAVVPTGGGGGKSGDRVLNRLGELRKQTVEILRDLYRARLEIERTGEDRSFELAKSAGDKYLDQLNDNLSHRLISTLDYYQKRKAVEDAAIARERKHLVDQFKFEERETVLAIGAIEDSFAAQSKEPKNKDARIQTELSKQQQLKVNVELARLEEKRVKMNKDILLLDERQAETTRKNNLGLEDGLNTLRKTNEGIQQQLLDAQGRTTAAEIRRISEQYRDELLTVLAETNPASEALADTIENIKQLGNVTSTQLLSILDQAGLKFDDLSEETKALIALLKRLEDSAVFKGLQNESQIKLGNLDVTRADVQDRINLGIITEAQGRHEIALAERAVRVELEKVLNLMSALPNLTDQERLALEQLRQQASQMGREIDTVGAGINDSIKNDLTTLGDSLIDDFKNLKQHSQDFFRSLVSDIGKAIFQALVLERLFQALGLNKQGTAGPGSAGGPGGLLSRIIGHAEGGYVDGPPGRDALLRRLTAGEWVIPADRVRQYGHGLMSSITAGTFGRGPALGRSDIALQQSAVAQRPNKYVFALDPDTIANELQKSAAFDKVFIVKLNQHRNALGF
jgi:hypothetical protein